MWEGNKKCFKKYHTKLLLNIYLKKKLTKISIIFMKKFKVIIHEKIYFLKKKRKKKERKLYPKLGSYLIVLE